MDLKQLKKYDNWIGKTPETVLSSVKSIGWDTVFPDKMYVWASKVRNYFNEEPLALKRLDKAAASVYLNRVEAVVASLHLPRYAKAYPHFDKELREAYESKYKSKPTAPSPNTPDPEWADSIAENRALSDDVYTDEAGRIWYQMSPGGTIYHWKDPSYPTLEAINQNFRGQEATPVFKLVSPDGTGGSRECCIYNPLKKIKMLDIEVGFGRSNLGAVNKWLNVSNLIVYDPRYQGSYNYSETVEKGLAAHDMRDVKPHPHSGAATYYVDPIRFTPLSTRFFPEMDNQKPPRRLADQV